MLKGVSYRMESCNPPSDQNLGNIEIISDAQSAPGIKMAFRDNGNYGKTGNPFIKPRDIKAAYACAYDTSFTDDASVALKYGLSIRRIPGLKYNIKLTTPEDLAVAERLVSICLSDGSLPCGLKR